MEASCLACDLASGRRLLPGGLIYRTASWLVEHCVGPLGLGTLIVKPERHVTAVADLSLAEAAELGPLLVLASRVAGQLAPASQVYAPLLGRFEIFLGGAAPSCGHEHPVRCGRRVSLAAHVSIRACLNQARTLTQIFNTPFTRSTRVCHKWCASACSLDDARKGT